MKNETYEKLVKLGTLEDSFDSVICKLLNTNTTKGSESEDSNNSRPTEQMQEQTNNRSPPSKSNESVVL